jgi:hypothetical protein
MTCERTESGVAELADVRRETRLPLDDPRYVPPTAHEVREILHLLGVNPSLVNFVGTDGPTLRTWIGGESDIPYSAWRVLLIEAELALSA